MQNPLIRLFETLAEVCSHYQDGGAFQLATTLKKIVDPENESEVYSNIRTALKLANDIGHRRRIGYDESFFADPLAIIQVFAELRAKNPVSPSPIDQETILAAILYPVLRLKPDIAPTGQIAVISKHMDRIKETFAKNPTLGENVEKLVRNTLQLSELSLKAQITAMDSTGNETPLQTEADRIPSFLHMVAGSIEDNRAILIRGAQQLVHMRALMQSSDMESRQEIPQCAELTKTIYIPLVRAYGYHALKNELQDQALWMMNPEHYIEVRERILNTAQQAALPHKQKYICNTGSAKAVAKDVEEALHSLLPSEYVEFCHIESRIKDVVSTANKFNKKGEENIYDIIASRIIVTVAPLHPEDSIQTIEKQVRTAVGKINKAITAAAKGTKHLGKGIYLGKLPEEEENRFKDYYSKPKKNGYRALHNTFCIIIKDQGSERHVYFELQIVDKVSHENNQCGTASHAGVYKPGAVQVDVEKAKKTVAVFTPENNICELPRGATVADFLAATGPLTAFSATDIKIERIHHCQAPSADSLYEQVLHPGDRITFDTDHELSQSPEHRERVVLACRTTEMQDVLRLAGIAPFHGTTPSRKTSPEKPEQTLAFN